MWTLVSQDNLNWTSYVNGVTRPLMVQQHRLIYCSIEEVEEQSTKTYSLITMACLEELKDSLLILCLKGGL